MRIIMNQFAVFLGVTRYEFRMQIRRKAVWIPFVCVSILLVARGGGGIFRDLLDNQYHLSLLQLVATWTNSVNTLFPIIVGILLADRFARDRKTKVDEIFATTAAALNTRLAGKYVGSVFATIIPFFLFYCVGIAAILFKTQNLVTIPYALIAFAAIVLPGMLFVGAFSIACPSIMWVPLYQFLFVGYWFWGNLLNPAFGIPTLSATILTPSGGFISSGLFGDPFARHGATALQGIESIILLLAISLLVMIVLWGLLKWQQARQ